MKGQAFKMFFYTGCLLIGLGLLTVGVCFFMWRQDRVGDVWGRYSLYLKTRDITVSIPGGSTFSFKVERGDRQVAWRIYNQLNTRLAAVDFNEEYDSLYVTDKSLFEAFQFIREQIGKIPFDKFARNENDDTAKFYTAILNDGIRPYLSKWHDPISKWVEHHGAQDGKLTYLEIEATFPRRKEAIADIKKMNERMKLYSQRLLSIVRAEDLK